MIWKLILTLVMLLGGYGLIRARIRAERIERGLIPRPAPWLPPGAIRLGAWSLLALMLSGSAIVFFLDWRKDREVVLVQVVNANTGAITEYRARRGGMEGRRFVTLDGREIRMADVERMIVLQTPMRD